MFDEAPVMRRSIGMLRRSAVVSASYSHLPESNSEDRCTPQVTVYVAVSVMGAAQGNQSGTAERPLCPRRQRSKTNHGCGLTCGSDCLMLLGSRPPHLQPQSRWSMTRWTSYKVGRKGSGGGNRCIRESVLGFDPFGGLFGGDPSIPWQMRYPKHGVTGILEAGYVDPVNQKDTACLHCACQSCHTESMVVTAYDNGYASTQKRSGDAGYGMTASQTLAGMGTIAAPSRFRAGTAMYVPGCGNGIVWDRGGDIQGNRLDVWLPPPLSKKWGKQTLAVEVCDDP